MTKLEKLAAAVRHSCALRRFDRVWNAVRPVYDSAMQLLAPNGLRRAINGTDAIRISAKLRNMPEEYEADVWARVMGELRAGDVFVDVGSYVGLYACAAAYKVGGSGTVYAFEPDPANYEILLDNRRVNSFDARIVCERNAVAAQAGVAAFRSGKGSESRLQSGKGAGDPVKVVAIDDYFTGHPINVLKIDVEGYEHAVLQGAAVLLADKRRRPRVIFIEVHPFAWGDTGASSDGILSMLHDRGYSVAAVDGSAVSRIDEYGEIIAVAEGETMLRTF